MRVCVLGLGHLGVVTAAGLTAVGHEVVGLGTEDEAALLASGEAPVVEPGLAALLAEPRWSADPTAALAGAEVLWLALDTPVDDDDRADVGAVLERFAGVAPHATPGSLVVVSSQLPIGTVARLEAAWPALAFACVPENLRLGAAVRSFLEPERIVVGSRGEAGRDRLAALLTPLAAPLEWMSVESAELVKHALNAFLATSIAFTNEIAAVCELAGADAKEVERGLRSDPRVGPRAYVAPGPPFAGGTLARDLRYLVQRRPESVLLPAVLAANEAHKGWVRDAVGAAVGALAGRTVAVWGLAYKPESDSVRRSESVALCTWLAGRGAHVRAHDPAVRRLPSLAATLCETPLDAAAGAHALVVATAWREYRELAPDAVIGRMAEPVVVDAGRFLADTLGCDARVRYLTVGAPWAH